MQKALNSTRLHTHCRRKFLLFGMQITVSV